MTEKIEKSFRNFVPHEIDKEFKRMYQSASPENRRRWALISQRTLIGMKLSMLDRRMNGCGTVSLWIEFIIPK